MRRAGWIGCVFALAVAGQAGAQPVAPPPKGAGPPAVLELLEDDVEGLIAQLTADQGTRIGRDFRDFYSGVCSIRVAPLQGYTSLVKGWSHVIAEKPGPGEYRYLRFAWKRVGGDGIMIQL